MLGTRKNITTSSLFLYGERVPKNVKNSEQGAVEPFVVNPHSKFFLGVIIGDNHAAIVANNIRHERRQQILSPPYIAPPYIVPTSSPLLCFSGPAHRIRSRHNQSAIVIVVLTLQVGSILKHDRGGALLRK